MNNNELNKLIDEELKKLTLKDKLSLLYGETAFTTNSKIKNINVIKMSDGPNGLRTQKFDEKAGFTSTIPAICYPSPSAISCSFNRELEDILGDSLAKECLKNGVNLLLAPAVNHKRNPMGGRNFEYYSEDPYLTSELAIRRINAIQKYNIGCCLKHFACNNQENDRFISDSIVDDRALFEIYLKQFKRIIEKSHPYSIMTAYNKINGIYCSENKYLLNEVARNKFGFDGAFITDWGALNDVLNSFKNGLNLEMPGCNQATDVYLYDLLKENKINEEEINNAVKENIKLAYKVNKSSNNKEINLNYDEMLNNIKKISDETIVLLKNDNNVLPIKKEEKILIIGPYFKNPHIQGGGSSHVNPIKVISPFDEFKNLSNNFIYKQGFNIKNNKVNNKLEQEVLKIVNNFDKVIFFCGLEDGQETENYDRNSFQLPKNQLNLINKITQLRKDLIVILDVGTPVELPFINDIRGLILMQLNGTTSGSSIANVLFGNINPNGKTSETWPKKLNDVPCYNYQNDINRNYQYRESIYTGYRYYNSANIDVLFEFGYGLSYTKFEYSNLKLDKKTFDKNDKEITLSFELKNIGNFDGKEIVEVYFSKPNSKIFRAEKELCQFEKIYLKPGETQKVEIKIEIEDLKFFNTILNDYDLENGEYIISVGSSSRNILLTEKIYIYNVNNNIFDYHKNNEIYFDAKNMQYVSQSEFESLLNKKITSNISKEINRNSTIKDVLEIKKFYKLFTPLLNLIYFIQAKKQKMKFNEFKRMLFETPIRSYEMNNNLNKYYIDALILILNSHLIKGIKLYKCSKKKIENFFNKQK